MQIKNTITIEPVLIILLLNDSVVLCYLQEKLNDLYIFFIIFLLKNNEDFLFQKDKIQLIFYGYMTHMLLNKRLNFDFYDMLIMIACSTCHGMIKWGMA